MKKVHFGGSEAHFGGRNDVFRNKDGAAGPQSSILGPQLRLGQKGPISAQGEKKKPTRFGSKKVPFGVWDGWVGPKMVFWGVKIPFSVPKSAL